MPFRWVIRLFHRTTNSKEDSIHQASLLFLGLGNRIPRIEVLAASGKAHRYFSDTVVPQTGLSSPSAGTSIGLSGTGGLLGDS